MDCGKLKKPKVNCQFTPWNLFFMEYSHDLLKFGWQFYKTIFAKVPLLKRFFPKSYFL